MCLWPHSSQRKVPSGMWVYPSIPLLIIRLHSAQWVGLNFGGLVSFSKLCSLVPYHTYISTSISFLHLSQVCHLPECPSVWWYPHKVYLRWFRLQLTVLYENNWYLSSSSQIHCLQHSVLTNFVLLPHKIQFLLPIFTLESVMIWRLLAYLLYNIPTHLLNVEGATKPLCGFVTF